MDDNSNRVHATLLSFDPNQFEGMESLFKARRGASIHCRGVAKFLSDQPVNG